MILKTFTALKCVLITFISSAANLHMYTFRAEPELWKYSPIRKSSSYKCRPGHKAQLALVIAKKFSSLPKLGRISFQYWQYWRPELNRSCKFLCFRGFLVFIIFILPSIFTSFQFLLFSLRRQQFVAVILHSVALYPRYDKIKLTKDF